MLELLKEIILDAQAEVLSTGTRRHLRVERVAGKACICMGVRRCGKSTLLYQIVEDLLKEGVPRENILYINFFDDRLAELKRSGPGDIAEAYFAIYPEKKGRETIYCFFDEIQEAHHWESFVDRLLRTEKCEIFITGSSAKMLSREIATQMRGRALSWELFPFSFPEYLDHRSVDYRRLTSKNRLLVQKQFAAYWKSGGFPEVLDVTGGVRVMILQEYYKTILHRDIIERFDAMHPQAVIEAGRRLMSHAATLYTINRMTDYLKSLGFKVSKSFVGECIQWFEDAFFLFSVRLFDRSVARQNVNPRKIYCIDHAMILAVGGGLSADMGRLLENLVFIQLRRLSERIYYYRTKRGREVDFVWIDEEGVRRVVQVCYTLVDPATRKRELRGLTEAMDEVGVERGTVVTYGEEESLEEAGKKIDVVPAWKFLMDPRR